MLVVALSGAVLRAVLDPTWRQGKFYAAVGTLDYNHAGRAPNFSSQALSGTHMSALIGTVERAARLDHGPTSRELRSTLSALDPDQPSGGARFLEACAGAVLPGGLACGNPDYGPAVITSDVRHGRSMQHASDRAVSRTNARLRSRSWRRTIPSSWGLGRDRSRCGPDGTRALRHRALSWWRSHRKPVRRPRGVAKPTVYLVRARTQDAVPAGDVRAGCWSSPPVLVAGGSGPAGHPSSSTSEVAFGRSVRAVLPPESFQFIDPDGLVIALAGSGVRRPSGELVEPCRRTQLVLQDHES